MPVRSAWQKTISRVALPRPLDRSRSLRKGGLPQLRLSCTLTGDYASTFLALPLRSLQNLLLLPQPLNLSLIRLDSLIALAALSFRLFLRALLLGRKPCCKCAEALFDSLEQQLELVLDEAGAEHDVHQSIDGVANEEVPLECHRGSFEPESNVAEYPCHWSQMA